MAGESTDDRSRLRHARGCVVCGRARRHRASRAAGPWPSQSLSRSPTSRQVGGPAAGERAAGPADLRRHRPLPPAVRAAASGQMGRRRSADRRAREPVLVGHVLAERYLARKAPRASFAELRGWLEGYGDLPQAQRIYKLALARKPAGADRPDAAGAARCRATACPRSVAVGAVRHGGSATRRPRASGSRGSLATASWTRRRGPARRSGRPAPTCAASIRSGGRRCCAQPPMAATSSTRHWPRSCSTTASTSTRSSDARRQPARLDGGLSRGPANAGARPDRRGRARRGRAAPAGGAYPRRARPAAGDTGPGDRGARGGRRSRASLAQGGAASRGRPAAAGVAAGRRLQARSQPHPCRDPGRERVRPGRAQPQGRARADAGPARYRARRRQGHSAGLRRRGLAADPPNNMAVGQAWLRQLAGHQHRPGQPHPPAGRLQCRRGPAGRLARQRARGQPGRSAAVHRERAAGGDPQLHEEGARQSVGVPGDASASARPR